MEQRGFIRDMLEIKVLILYITNKAMYPMDMQKIYEICSIDSNITYFDVSIAVPELLETGHLIEAETGTYVITQKGRDNEAVTYDTIPYSLAQKAQREVEHFNKTVKRAQIVHTEYRSRESGDYVVTMKLDDAVSNLMTLELMAPTAKQARALANTFNKRAEEIFTVILNEFLNEEETFEK